MRKIWLGMGNVYAFLVLCCEACKVELVHTQAEIEAMPNGSELLSVYTENNIETYRMCCSMWGRCWEGFSASAGKESWNCGSMGAASLPSADRARHRE